MLYVDLSVFGMILVSFFKDRKLSPPKKRENIPCLPHVCCLEDGICDKCPCRIDSVLKNMKSKPASFFTLVCVRACEHVCVCVCGGGGGGYFHHANVPRPNRENH